jgi:hypothetical protein
MKSNIDIKLNKDAVLKALVAYKNLISKDSLKVIL